jgi:hypothetical protein
VETDPSFDLVGEVDAFGCRIEDLDVHDLGVEDLLDPVAHEVVHRLHLEVLGQAALDVVDERELGVALPRLLEQAGVLERGAMCGRRRSEPVRLGVPEVLIALGPPPRLGPD